jgi:hypothetical protein
MIYALTITIAVGLLLLALLGIGVLLARRTAGSGWPSIGRWRWYPSPLGLLLLLPLAALVLWRLFPAILLIPIILPFFWRTRRLATPFLFVWNLGRRPPPPDAGHDGNDRTIEGQYRPLDDD